MGVVSCGTTMLDQGLFQNIGTVTWDTTAKTADFTAVSGNGYFVNTTSGEITVTLPAGSAGLIVALKDYANTWDTNNVTVAPNGTDKIGGINATTSLSTESQSVTLIYVDSTKGWQDIHDSTSNIQGETFITATGGTITTSGDYKIHKFTSPGTFTVSSLGSTDAANIVSYMVVAGGGGGNGMEANDSQGGGGGGAGGFREYKGPLDNYTASPIVGSPSISVTATAYPITVGGGGAGGTRPTGGATGSSSVFSTITSAGGGGVNSGQNTNGKTGGSGGGGNANSGGGAAGNTPPVSPPQGNPGGNGFGHPSNPQPDAGVYGAGAGGGATGTGGPGITASSGVNSGINGTGATTSISGSPTLYAEGGGGANFNRPADPNHSQGSGGNAGHGPYPSPNNPGESGVANTGGGGGGGSAGGAGSGITGGSGGSGIVIIRYKYQ